MQRKKEETKKIQIKVTKHRFYIPNFRIYCFHFSAMMSLKKVGFHLGCEFGYFLSCLF